MGDPAVWTLDILDWFIIREISDPWGTSTAMSAALSKCSRIIGSPVMFDVFVHSRRGVSLLCRVDAPLKQPFARFAAWAWVTTSPHILIFRPSGVAFGNDGKTLFIHDIHTSMVVKFRSEVRCDAVGRRCQRWIDHRPWVTAAMMYGLSK